MIYVVCMQCKSNIHQPFLLNGKLRERKQKRWEKKEGEGYEVDISFSQRYYYIRNYFTSTEKYLYCRSVSMKCWICVKHDCTCFEWMVIKMRVKHHYYLEATPRLMNFLNEYNVPYDLSRLPEASNNICTFDLYEDKDSFEKFKRQFPFVSRFNSIKSVEYSKKDIEDAEWLTIRNKNIKVQWEYEENAFHRTCSYKRPFIKELYYRHSEQVDVLSVSKPVKWGKRQFFSGPNAADDIIFCSEEAKELLNGKWQGLEFWPVKKCNNSKYTSDLYQLFFVESLPIEAISGDSVICDICGRKMIYITEATYQLKIRKEYLRNRNKVYKTGDVLIGQRKNYTTFSVNIVPKEFYQFCEKRQMNRGMVYEPIKLV